MNEGERAEFKWTGVDLVNVSTATHLFSFGCAVRGRNVVLSGPADSGLLHFLPFLPSLNEI